MNRIAERFATVFGVSSLASLSIIADYHRSSGLKIAEHYIVKVELLLNDKCFTSMSGLYRRLYSLYICEWNFSLRSLGTIARDGLIGVTLWAHLSLGKP
jgi:hypothetical protein